LCEGGEKVGEGEMVLKLTLEEAMICLRGAVGGPIHVLIGRVANERRQGGLIGMVKRKRRGLYG